MVKEYLKLKIMADNEEYFPRGGKKPTTTYFKQSANFLGAPEKRDKKKKPKKKSEGDDGYLSDDNTKVFESFKNCAYGLSYKTIKEGVLILGRVKNILETKIVISLPCRIIGSVMACHISEAYNKQLELYVSDKVDKVTELSQMFRPGQYVAVKVLEVKELSIMLSMMPQHINGQKKQSELRKGVLLQAAVVSEEDHGYVMDIGIPDVRAFMPKNKINTELQLDIGILTWCVVKSISDSGVVTLSNELSALQCCLQKQKTNSPLLPGSTLEFLVDMPLDNGIEGHVFEDTTAYIQRQHADNVKGKKPALGQKVRARLLYVMPTRNSPFLTMKNIFETTYPDLENEQKLKDGDIVENAKVLKITGRSVHFKLRDECYGTMSLKRIHVDEELADEEVIAKSYPIGSVHKVRVLCYNLSDYVYSITDQPDVVGERYFNLEQLAVGQLVEATVKSVADNHVLLNVGRVTGYVSQAHLSDSGIFIDPKKTSTSKLSKKKYKVGQSVTARVLVVDTLKQSLYLTLKSSLLAEDLEVLSSYDQALIGKSYTGVIKTVRDYVLVSFFNNVTAFVSRQYVTTEPLDNVAEAFHIGQIVNCTILKVDPEAKKMSGSLTTTPFWPQVKRQRPDKRKKNADDNVTTKKVKTDDVQLKVKNKKQKKEETECDAAESSDIEQKESKKKNRDSDDVQTLEDNAKKTERKSKKRKLNSDDIVESNVEQETEINKKDQKKEKLKNKSIEPEDTEMKTDKKEKKSKKPELYTENTEHTEIKTDKKEKRKNEKKTKIPDVDTEVNDKEIDTKDETKKKKKDKVKQKEEIRVSEESDEIETDYYEDCDPVLSPQELGLVDFTDCNSRPQLKKRVNSLIKSIKSRRRRIEKVDQKINKLELKGMDANNKKFHAAMHAEKIVLEKRIEKLQEALSIAQEKLNGFPEEDKVDSKKKKEKKVDKVVSAESATSVSGNKDISKKNVNKNIDIKVAESLEPALDAPSVKDFWAASDNTPKDIVADDSSSSEDEEQDQPKKKRKKLTVAEKLAKVREEEERVREMERRAIESESQPRSSDQFERALLANPNCSQLWIAYMAFHLQATEVEKARAVGRKALNTISFREEEEKLNVCLAILNFEHRFGTKESQEHALDEALKINEPFKVYSKLLDIYVETSKHQELAALVRLMLGKFKRDPNNYITCGAACFKLGLVGKARQVMQKAIAVLEKKEHVTVLVQFALLERTYGDRERSEALFEQILTTYPGRVDVCCTYVDMLVKSGDIANVREVMSRVTSQKLPARKAKSLFSKWVQVEQKFGDEEQVARVRQLALDYVEKAKF